MIYLEIFWSFVKIGFTSFGGLSMIPLISSEMISHNWMNAHEVADIVAIAEMTPGPLGLNCATFAGFRAAGVLGAFVANLGTLSPTLTLCAIAAIFFDRFRDNKYLGYVMTGVRPACVGMVAGVVLELIITNFVDASGSVYMPSVILGIIDLILLMKIKFSIPKVIIFNAVAGIILFGVIKL